MQQPNPWVLFMGGLMLFQVAAMAWGLKAPQWIRLVAVAVCVVSGLLSVGIALKKQFGKKPAPPPKVVLKRERKAQEMNRQESSKDAN